MLRGYAMLSCSVVLLALFASVQGRAVNISNTWVLPEEGFPVFYRYFRDRISWYEADAVCQFHHANLVTVDTTPQYDAVRAYLKELDISSAVWVGLIRSNPDGEFTWTDYRGLSGDGYWSSAPDARAAPLCAAADPAADYRWEARACGGPTVASFICELPVPQWALGNQGCMVRELPALTILYLPESAAVQLTADCGLAGTKRIQCTGNVKREELLRNLSCAEEEDLSSTLNIISAGTTGIVTTDTAFTDQDTTNDVTTDENTTTEFEIDTNQQKAVKVTSIPFVQEKLPVKMQTKINKFNTIYSQKDINLDLIHNNNLQSNDIPKLANTENFLTVEQTEKLEDEKHMHHKMLHDELARHGNFETIFNQPTDHFIPPLVMAKAKISDDMIVLSLAEKHAQQLAEQRFVKHTDSLEEHSSYLNEDKHLLKSTTEEPHKVVILEKPLVAAKLPNKIKDYGKKDNIKSQIPKKYKEKDEDLKGKKVKQIDNKLLKFEKPTNIPLTETSLATKGIETTTVQETRNNEKNNYEEEPSIDLTVMLKELGIENSRAPLYDNYSRDVPKKYVSENRMHLNESDSVVINTESVTSGPASVVEAQTHSTHSVTLNHEVIRITIINDDDSSSPTSTVFEVTTRMPEFKDNIHMDNSLSTTTSTQQPLTTHITSTDDLSTNQQKNKSDISTASVSDLTTTTNAGSKDVSSTPRIEISSTEKTLVNTTVIPVNTATENKANDVDKQNIETVATTTNTLVNTVTEKIEVLNNHTEIEEDIKNVTKTVEIKIDVQPSTEAATTANNIQFPTKEVDDLYNYTTSHEEYYAKNWTDTLDTTEDFQSPLLSAANEPLHRPNRSRRPQPPNRLNKFNPFRILG